MAKLVTLHDADGEVIYPQSVWDENMIPDNTIKSSMIDWTTMPGSYSTTEQKTPFTWIDGKPIYRKVVTVSNPSFSVADHSQAHGISGFSSLVNLRTLFNLGWEKTTWASADFLAQRGCSMRIDPTYVYWENTNSSIANWTGTLVFIIEFTKKTD